MKRQRFILYPVILIILVSLLSLPIVASSEAPEQGFDETHAVPGENEYIRELADGEAASGTTDSEVSIPDYEASGEAASGTTDSEVAMPDDEAGVEASSTTDSEAAMPDYEAGDEANGTTDSEAAIPDDEAMPIEGENFFSTLFESLKTYATEIFSALAFIVSLILAYAYKSGLTPVITNALKNFGTLIGSMRKEAKESESAQMEITRALGERLAIAEETTLSLAAGIERVSEAMGEIKRQTGEEAKLREVLTAQIDMLYSIFMSSALPEYQKAAVAERIERMKEAIRNEEA